MSRSTRRRAAALTAATVVLAGVAGCAATTEEGPGAQVDVATPELQRLRAQAGIEPCVDGSGATGERPEALPDLTLPCLGGGESVDLAGLRGPTVITVWAQWCAPCRAELPIFQQLADTGAVDVLGINYLDTQPRVALELLREKGVTFPSVADPGARLKEAYPWLTGLPLLMMVDEDGTVAFSEFREITSYDDLAGLVETELGVTP